MGMDDIWLEIVDHLSQLGNLAEVAPDSIPIHAKEHAVNALFFNGLDLLRDERSVVTIFAAGDDEDSHMRLKQSPAAELEEGPGKFHSEDYKAPWSQEFVSLF